MWKGGKNRQFQQEEIEASTGYLFKRLTLYTSSVARFRASVQVTSTNDTKLRRRHTSDIVPNSCTVANQQSTVQQATVHTACPTRNMCKAPGFLSRLCPAIDLICSQQKHILQQGLDLSLRTMQLVCRLHFVVGTRTVTKPSHPHQERSSLRSPGSLAFFHPFSTKVCLSLSILVLATCSNLRTLSLHLPSRLYVGSAEAERWVSL